jgi:hypothetical protein
MNPYLGASGSEHLNYAPRDGGLDQCLDEADIVRVLR